MRTWFRSAQTGVALSYVALLSLMVRSYADTRYILVEDFSALGTDFVAVWILGYTAIIGGWVWALLAATRNRRGAWIALLGFALLTGLGFGAASLLAFTDFTVELTLFGANLLTGVIASVAVGIQLWGK